MVLAIQGSLQQAWFAAGTFNRAYFAVGDASWIRIPSALAVDSSSIRPLTELLAFPLLGVILIVVSWLRHRHGREDSGRKTAPELLFWLWLLLAGYLACVGPGRRGHHMLPTLAPLGLLALTPIGHLVRRRGLSASVAARPSIADIMSSPPTVFVISTGDYAAMRGDENDRFGQWIGSRYVDRGVIEGMHLLIRGPPRGGRIPSGYSSS